MVKMIHAIANKYNFVEADGNRLIIKFQDGSVKHKGVNGMQPSILIRIAIDVFSALNSELFCEENTYTIDHLVKAFMWQDKRTTDRSHRGVEGTLNK